MINTEEFRELCISEPFEALSKIVEYYFNIHSLKSDITDYIECGEIASRILKNNDFIIVTQHDFSYDDSCIQDSQIFDAFYQLNDKINEEKIKRKKIEVSEKFAFIENKFYYSISDDDIKRIQDRINELRGLLSASNDLTEDHKRRLLLKLEKLQQELHKKMSDLDHIYGLIGDAGVLVGKFGNDVKPIVDRIKDIVSIAMNIMLVTNGLPSGSVAIPLPDTSEDSDSK